MEIHIQGSDREQPGGCGRLFLTGFFLLFFGMGLLFVVIVTGEVLRHLDPWSWSATPCEVVSSEVVTTGDDEAPYRATVQYRYVADGATLLGDRVTVSDDGTSRYRQALLTTLRYPAGRTVRCYVDPDEPSRAVLERTVPWFTAIIVVPLIFMAIGAGGLYFAWRRGSTDEGGRPISDAAASSHRGIWLQVGFGMIFVLVGGGFFIGMALLPALHLLEAQWWEATSCTIVSSTVRSHQSDDGTTYSVDILYEYEWDGGLWRSNSSSFVTWSSSGYDSKAEQVAQHPPGSTTVCFVDPDDPTRAVLERGLSLGYLLGLLPLIFVVAGGAVAGHGLSRRRRHATAVSAAPAGVAEQTAAVLPVAAPTVGPVVLKPATGPVMKALGMTFMALFWNGIVSIFVYQAVEGFRSGSPDWVLAVFMVPFVLVGLLLIGLVVKFALAVFNPRPQLTVSSPSPRLGQALQVQWQFNGSVRRLQRLRITLQGREEATYRRGTDTRTDTEVFSEITVLDTRDQMQMRRGSTLVEIPDDTMHSFDADNNVVAWAFEIDGEIARWPDVDERFEIAVRPALLEEPR